MCVQYGLMAGLAIALAGAVQAEPNLPQVKVGAVREVSLNNVRMATVRQASVTVVNQLPDIGLSGATKQVEDYFNNASTVMAEFTQTVTGEAKPSKGMFYWSKPGRFLWQYMTPVKQKIISTGSAVYYMDEERNQVTQLPMNAGVARLFNAKTLNMSQQGLRATNVQTTSSRLVETFAVDRKIKTGDQTGLVSLKLSFDRLPGGRLKLSQIDALDTLSVTTRVEFANLRENVPLPTKMFEFTPGVYQQRN